MTSLYALTEEIRDIERVLDDADLTDEEQAAVIDRWLADTSEAIDEKVDNYCGLIREYETRCGARAAEAERLRELSISDNNKAKRLRERLFHCLDAMQITKPLETARFKVSIVRNGGSPPIEVDPIQPDELPSRFVRYPEPVVDKTALREALAAGEEFPWARYGERGRRLVVK